MINTVNKIKVLSPDQAIKIAAGEVVERPVNIIKELIENSIDAQATKISIFITQAGKQLIKIIDNGHGMNPDDAKLSVAQHATSKITSVDDLQTITSFGFRGEALASINAVSNVTITTKTIQDQTGAKIAWNFGILKEESFQSHPTGTTLEIANLFDNIPARKKFLKKDETEWRAIITLFQAFCLDYCNIHFQLYNENKLQFNCPPVNSLSHRATQLFDNNIQEKIYELTHLENKLCSVVGTISIPTYYRYDRNQIFIFVNNRWIKNIDLTKAIMRGYAGTLPPQKYPVATIFITIPTDQIDINIHPKKEEIKFLHPKKVEAIIINSIKATLDTYALQNIAKKTFNNGLPSSDNIILHHKPTFLQPAHQIDIEEKESFSFLKQSDKQNSLQTKSILSTELNRTVNKDNHLDQYKTVKTIEDQPIDIPHLVANHFENIKTVIPAIEDEQDNFIKQTEQEFSIIGQYKKTYIIGEKGHNLVLIDQHAAHERILYEQFKKNFQNIATIQLMFPEFIKLQKQDILTIAPYLQILHNHGITAQIFSDTQLIIQAMPVHLKNQLLVETIQQIIGWIKEIEEADQTKIILLLNEKIHTKMACSAAIKAGDFLNIEQIEQLVKTLQSTEHKFSCPHGRPTFWTLPLEIIEKNFKRDYKKKAEQLFDFL